MKNKTSLSPTFKKSLFQMASNLNEVSRGWVVSYDPETDSLSFSKKELDNNTKVSYLDPEIAVYLSPKNTVQGIFIEYVTKNYLSHNKNLVDFKKKLIMINKNDEDKSFVRVNRSEAKDFISVVQEEIQNIVINNLNFPPIAIS